MLIKKIIFLVLLIIVFSCDKAVSKRNIEVARDSLVSNTLKVNYPVAKLNSKAKKLVENWDEYQNIEELLKQYQHITTNMALLNAKELSVLSKQLKDSIRVEQLNIPAVKIRLNVLHNETLRLADMETIPSITESEVIEEKNNILDAYSALNLKINNIVNQENLNQELSNFVDEVLNLNDSLKKTDTIKLTPVKK